MTMPLQDPVDDQRVSESKELVESLRHILKDTLNIGHTTFQIEHRDCEHADGNPVNFCGNDHGE